MLVSIYKLTNLIAIIVLIIPTIVDMILYGTIFWFELLFLTIFILLLLPALFHQEGSTPRKIKLPDIKFPKIKFRRPETKPKEKEEEDSNYTR